MSWKISNIVCLVSVILVENVLNLYSLVVLIVISIFFCYVVIYHYEDIKHGQGGGDADKQKDEDTFPFEFLVFYLLITISTILPFGRSTALRFDLFLSCKKAKIKIKGCVGAIQSRKLKTF